jgi:hypothetical protein
MNITTLLAIGLTVVTLSLIILFLKHRKLNSDFRNYNPNPVFGPGRYNYGRNDPSRIAKEMRAERFRSFFTLKWTWYWTTKKYRKERKTRKEFSKIMLTSIERKKQAKTLSERNKNIERDGSHVVIKTKNNKKLSKNFKTSGTK